MMVKEEKEEKIMRVIEKYIIDGCMGLIIFLSEVQEGKNYILPDSYFLIEKSIQACNLLLGLTNHKDKEKRKERIKIICNYFSVNPEMLKREKLLKIKKSLENIRWKGKKDGEGIKDIIDFLLNFSPRGWQKILRKILEGEKVTWEEVINLEEI